MALSDANKAGALLFLGVLQFAVFELVASTLYPGYSIANNYISDLGPPCLNGTACPSQQSWLVFDSSIIILGLMIIASAYYFYRYFKWRPLAGMIAVTGIAATMIGIFTENAPYPLHAVFSLIAFLGAGLTAVMAFRFQKSPMSYFSLALGFLILGSLLLYVPGGGTDYGPALGLGPGGLERMIVYPSLFWGLAFGGHLMALEEGS